jgi:hypothetical protein
VTLSMKVRRIGNSIGVVLPKEATTKLNIEEVTTFTSRRPQADFGSWPITLILLSK